MIVSRNRLTTEGLPAREKNDGGIVAIANLGIDDEYMAFLGLQNLAKQAKVNPLAQNALAILKVLLRVGGEVLFVENQCLLDGKLPRFPTIYAVLVFTLDDLGFSSNQIRVRHTDKNEFPLSVGSLLLSITLRVENNRFKETLAALRLSCVALALQTIGTGNIGTHCLSFAGILNTVKNANLVSPLFQSACEKINAGDN